MLRHHKKNISIFQYLQYLILHKIRKAVTKYAQSVVIIYAFSQADTQNGLEVGFGVFFFTTSCWLDLAIEES